MPVMETGCLVIGSLGGEVVPCWVIAGKRPWGVVSDASRVARIEQASKGRNAAEVRIIT